MENELEIETSPKKLLRIGVDIDNTIADSTPAYLSRLNDKFGTDFEYESHTRMDVSSYSVEVTRKQEEVFVYELERNRDFLMGISVYPQAVRVLRKWNKTGHKIFYITARPKASRSDTVSWLKQHNLYFPGIELILYDERNYDQVGPYKSQIAKEKRLDCMIEDSPEVVAHLTVPVIILDHPWNQHVSGSTISRVSNWDQIEWVVERMTFGRLRSNR